MISKPKDWHLYSPEMKRIWELEDLPRLIKVEKEAKQQLDDFMDNLKSMKRGGNSTIPF